jgi:hypothetical protein
MVVYAGCCIANQSRVLFGGTERRGLDANSLPWLVRRFSPVCHLGWVRVGRAVRPLQLLLTIMFLFASVGDSCFGGRIDPLDPIQADVISRDHGAPVAHPLAHSHARSLGTHRSFLLPPLVHNTHSLLHPPTNARRGACSSCTCACNDGRVARVVCQLLNGIAVSQWAVVNGTCFYCSNNFNDFPSSIVTLFEL